MVKEKKTHKYVEVKLRDRKKRFERRVSRKYQGTQKE